MVNFMNKKEQETLNYFGKLLMERARDNGIHVTDWLVSGFGGAPANRELQNKLSLFTDDQKETVKEVIMKVVDQTLHHVLWMFEQEEEIDLIVDGVNLREASDGLAGELYGEDGLVAKYSKERNDEK
jgi:uncharacterized membrane protein YqiK